jgi:hypothetical protein
MARYRMYSLDAFGRIGYAEDLNASTDEEAIAKVREIEPASKVCEIWEGRRLVATLKDQQLSTELLPA